MWLWVEISFVGKCSAYVGDKRKVCAVSFGGVQESSGGQ